MGKFKEMDLLRQEREAFDADYPTEPTPRADMWIAWNSEDGFTFWEDEQQAIRWSAADSNEYPVQYVMQKAQPAPVQEPIYQMQMMDGKWIDQAKQSYEYNKAHGHTVRIVYTTPPAQPAAWAGLTDEQIAIIYKAWQAVGADIRGLFWGDFVREITLYEAARGITEGGERG